MITQKKFGFDGSHENRLKIEDTAFSDFINYLFNSDFKIGKIEAGLTYEKLSNYDIFLIGVPRKPITPEEIEDLIKYVKDGGSLLLINDQGGDKENNNNLSELSKNFGISFNSDRLFDSEKYSKEKSRPLISNFKNHFITQEITEIIHSNGCTLKVDEAFEPENEDIKISVNCIAFSSEKTASHVYFNEQENDWIVEPIQKIPIMAAVHYGLGKVVAIGNLSLFSSMNYSYGIKAVDNFKLISNTISWLINKAFTEESQLIQPVYVTVPIEQDSYYWIKEKIEEGKWKNINEFINFAINVIKLRMKQEDDTD